MRSRWLVGVVAAVALFAVAACNDGAVAGQPTDVSTAAEAYATGDSGAQAGESEAEDSQAPASDPGSESEDAADPGETDAGGDSALPADPMAEPGPFDVDACAVLVRAAGADVIEAAMGDPVIDASSLFANCSMYTAEYTINDAGSTSTGRLSFGISSTSLAAIASPGAVPVDGLADSAMDESSILWHRGAYWFTLQILPVQKTATDPDVLSGETLINIARLIDANA